MVICWALWKAICCFVGKLYHLLFDFVGVDWPFEGLVSGLFNAIWDWSFYLVINKSGNEVKSSCNLFDPSTWIPFCCAAVLYYIPFVINVCFIYGSAKDIQGCQLRRRRSLFDLVDQADHQVFIGTWSLHLHLLLAIRNRIQPAPGGRCRRSSRRRIQRLKRQWGRSSRNHHGGLGLTIYQCNAVTFWIDNF